LDKHFAGLAQTRFGPANLREWLVLVVSVAVGALSHFFWDSWTHPWGEIARRIPLLLENTTVLGYTRPNCRYLQHLSTLAGAAAFAVFMFKSRFISTTTSHTTTKTSRQKLSFWLLGFAVALAGGAAAALAHHTLPCLIDSGFTYLRPTITAFGLGSWAAFFYYLCVRGALRRLAGQ
jgi:hypothetical protein